MDSERHGEDQHDGAGPEPKLSLVGRLDGELDGWPVSLTAASGAILVAGQLMTLLRLRRFWKLNQRTIRTLLDRQHVRLLLQIGWFRPVEVFPKPQRLIGLFLPSW